MATSSSYSLSASFCFPPPPPGTRACFCSPDVKKGCEGRRNEDLYSRPTRATKSGCLFICRCSYIGENGWSAGVYRLQPSARKLVCLLTQIPVIRWECARNTREVAGEGCFNQLHLFPLLENQVVIEVTPGCNFVRQRSDSQEYRSGR